MNHRLTAIALLAVAGALSGCASPNVTMGPDWARYVGSTYRHREMMASAAQPGADAAALEHDMGAANGSELAFDVPAPVAPAATQAVAVTTNKGTRTARSVAIPPRDEADLSAPAPAVASSANPAAAAAESVVPPAPPPSPRADTERSTDDQPAAARRFLRLRIGGMESPENDPMEVRRQLRTVDGVKEVVLSFKTRTAIVVVDKAVTADALAAALQAPYTAEPLN